MSKYLEPGKILGEDIEERLSRFGLIQENEHGNWDLTDRDENALRTGHALLLAHRDFIAQIRDATILWKRDEADHKLRQIHEMAVAALRVGIPTAGREGDT